MSVTINETRHKVIVKQDGGIKVVTVGKQGPPGQQGIQGIQGEQAYNDYTGTPKAADIIAKGPWVDVRAPFGLLDGAKGDGVTDDILSLRAAHDACPVGARLFIPPGQYRTTEPFVINKNIDVDMQGIIVADHAGIAIQTVNMGKTATDQFVPTLRLKAKRKTVDHSEGSTGIQIHNTYGCNIRVDYAAGFTTGLLLSAQGSGSVYNQISLGQLYNNKIQVDLEAQDATGWVNQNQFISGRLYYPNSGSRDGYIQIKIGSTNYANNGNIFIGTSLEDIGSGGQYAKAVKCDGWFNTFEGIRCEGSLDWELTASSLYNTIMFGPYLNIDRIVDNGSYNNILTVNNGFKMQNQSSATTHTLISHNGAQAALRLKNLATNGTRDVLQWDDALDNFAGSINPAGIWIVKSGTRKVVWGLYVGAPTSGDWTRGDISFVASPAYGGVVGYVCTTTGTPGTWYPMGMVGAIRAATQADSVAADVATLKTDFNALLAKLKTAGLMA